jgi:hypothetical protein
VNEDHRRGQCPGDQSRDEVDLLGVSLNNRRDRGNLRGSGVPVYEATNPAPEAEHVRTPYKTAPDPGERLPTVACCRRGVRLSEVAVLHRGQLVFDVETIDDGRNGVERV